MSYFEEPFFVEPKHHFIFAFQNRHEDLFHPKKIIGKEGHGYTPSSYALEIFFLHFAFTSTGFFSIIKLLLTGLL